MKHTLFILLFTPILTNAQEINFHGLVPFQVTSVFDGDGFKGNYLTGQKDEIRLLATDAGEKRGYSSKAQPYGNEAGDSLRLLIKGKTVFLDTLTIKGASQRDAWGRLIAVCYLDDATNVNYTAVSRGWAWHERVKWLRLPNLNTVLSLAQSEAKAAKLGLWNVPAGEPRPHRPSWWRKRYSIK